MADPTITAIDEQLKAAVAIIHSAQRFANATTPNASRRPASGPWPTPSNSPFLARRQAWR
jgi:hypothetical protein